MIRYGFCASETLLSIVSSWSKRPKANLWLALTDVKSPKRTLLVMPVLAVLASACHFSNSQYGPASAGVGPTTSFTTTTTTQPKLSGPASIPGTNPTSYDGAGFQIPNYPTTTLPGWKYGLPQSPTTISHRMTKYGDIITTANGRTLYVRIGDQFRKSGCFSICLHAFPPYLTNGSPMATGGLLASDIGVIVSNQNKGEQITYGGHPLYTYSGDTSVGDINAEGKGGIWFVIGVTGLPINSVPTGPGGITQVGSTGSATSTTTAG